MLTILVMMSGPHRYKMLETAIASIPLECGWLTHVILQHQGGDWDWGASLRQRVEGHPKICILEFEDRVGMAASFNRTLEHVRTPWVLILPDDDFLLTRATTASLDALARHGSSDEFGLFAFGWYYARRERYVASHVKGRGLLGALYYAPKMCSTFVNVKRLRQAGGFDERFGGFMDTALFGRLCFEYDAIVSQTPIGVYRIHDGQVSAAPGTYSPYAKDTFTTICGFAEDARERAAYEGHLAAYVSEDDRLLSAPLRHISYLLKSRNSFDDPQSIGELRTWSSLQRVNDPIGLRALLR